MVAAPVHVPDEAAIADPVDVLPLSAGPTVFVGRVEWTRATIVPAPGCAIVIGKSPPGKANCTARTLEANGSNARWKTSKNVAPLSTLPNRCTFVSPAWVTPVGSWVVPISQTPPPRLSAEYDAP